LLASAQAVEHYEIARYGTLKSWATALKLLDVRSTEEKKTDALLTKMAERVVNVEAQAS
jgi:ferritin-like metal-binding protein YciE